MKIEFWAGTDESYDEYSASLAKAQAYEARGGDTNMELPSLYKRAGNVGTITIAGSLIPGSSGWMRMFGIVGYDDIKAAVLEGVKDKGAAKLMLIGNSGGGAVDGVADTAAFIRAAAVAKPMTAFADLTASACYWIMSAAPHMTLADTGIAGSLGILKIHTEISQMDKKEGITRKVLRAGKNKARLNPYEPLTAEAEAEEQKKLDYLHDRFLGTVAHHRGVSRAEVTRNYGDGSTFIGTMALDVGLVDAVGSIGSALAYAKTNTKKLDASKIELIVTPPAASAAYNPAKLTNEVTHMKIIDLPTPEDLAAQAALDVEGDKTLTPTTVVPTDPQTPDLASLSANIDTLETSVLAKDAEIATLTASVAEKDTAVATATAAQATAEAALAEANATIEALKPAVQNTVKHLAVALNKQIDPVALDGKTLAATFVEYTASYTELFKSSKKPKPAPLVGDKGEQLNKPNLSATNTVPVDAMFNLRSKSLS